jgi:hypothetical protein
VIFFGLCGFLKSSHLRQASGGLNCSFRAFPVDIPWSSISHFSLNRKSEDDPWIQWWCTSPELHFDVLIFYFHCNFFLCKWWPESGISPEKMVVSTTIPTCMFPNPWIVSQCYNPEHPLWLLDLMHYVTHLTPTYHASSPLSLWFMPRQLMSWSDGCAFFYYFYFLLISVNSFYFQKFIENLFEVTKIWDQFQKISW